MPEMENQKKEKKKKAEGPWENKGRKSSDIKHSSFTTLKIFWLLSQTKAELKFTS